MFAIVLYVPDATLRASTPDGGLRELILTGVPELDFIAPAWWEGSYTARLGMIEPRSAGAEGCDSETGQSSRENPVGE